MSLESENITQEVVTLLNEELQQLLLRDKAKTTTEEDIKAEFEEQKKKFQRYIGYTKKGLTLLASIGDCFQRTILDREWIRLFCRAIRPLMAAVEHLKDFILVKIDERERIAVEENANSWNQLVCFAIWINVFFF